MSGGRGGGSEQLGTGGQRLGLLGRFIVYGLVGWCIECCFTSVVDLATGAGDWRLKGYSYLWMHPIWGVGLLLGEHLAVALERARISRISRALVGMAVCFTVEYVAGALLVAAIGRCPWDYSASPWSVSGLIRLDYAPCWWLVSFLFEPLASLVRRIRIFARESEPGAMPSAASLYGEGTRHPAGGLPSQVATLQQPRVRAHATG
ncbi:putative ABC transporter permease [Hyalangium sp.]|uniref:putative ABC transporter permease n=1 Tax=Hyalangium sp. TaxID=2028555 RepID=UPI002D4B0CF1|nr:putative ABC transporter permease [Hyalangium sp.]HYI00323.1 putative ABC transporter permease [Hyalangium sp.]